MAPGGTGGASAYAGNSIVRRAREGEGALALGALGKGPRGTGSHKRGAGGGRRESRDQACAGRRRAAGWRPSRAICVAPWCLDIAMTFLNKKGDRLVILLCEPGSGYGLKCLFHSAPVEQGDERIPSLIGSSLESN